MADLLTFMPTVRSIFITFLEASIFIGFLTRSGMALDQTLVAALQDLLAFVQAEGFTATGGLDF